MINYAEVLADLELRRSNLDAAILAIEPMVGKKEKRGGGHGKTQNKWASREAN